MPNDERPAPHTITTVTCGKCGVVYVKTDADGSEYQHFCEDASFRTPPPTGVSAQPTAAPDEAVTLAPSGKVAARDAIPEDARAAMRDPARLMGQYVLVKQIGKGGMGTVWKAYDRNLSRWAAIKFLTGTSEDEVQRFTREAKVAAHIRHPNIAAIYEMGQARGQYFIAMEFVDGLPLDQTQLPLRELTDVMRQVVLAIDTAHKSDIIHRDIKPQNIMVTKNGWPFVLDFGLAKQFTGQNTLSMSGMVMGTPSYMPPEQAQGHLSKIDARSDVYSLGATLYALVTGQPPFKGDSPMSTILSVVHDEPVHPQKLKPDCPPEIATIILKAMEKEPGRRYQSAAELAEDLRRYRDDESLLAKPPSVAYRFLKSLRRNKLAYALAGTVILASAVVTLVLLLRAPTTVIVADDQWTKLWDEACKPLVQRDFTGQLDRGKFAAALRGIPGLDQQKKVVGFFDGEVRDAEGRLKELRQDKSRWLGHADPPRIRDWAREARALLAQAKGDAFSKLLKPLESLEAEATHMAAYRGQATLLIHVVPFARVKSLASGPETVVKDEDLPLRLELDVRDYDLVLEHPELGERTVRIAASALRNGGTFVLGGDMAKPDSITLKSGK